MNSMVLFIPVHTRHVMGLFTGHLIYRCVPIRPNQQLELQWKSSRGIHLPPWQLPGVMTHFAHICRQTAAEHNCPMSDVLKKTKGYGWQDRSAADSWLNGHRFHKNLKISLDTLGLKPQGSYRPENLIQSIKFLGWEILYSELNIA